MSSTRSDGCFRVRQRAALRPGLSTRPEDGDTKLPGPKQAAQMLHREKIHSRSRASVLPCFARICSSEAQLALAFFSLYSWIWYRENIFGTESVGPRGRLRSLSSHGRCWRGSASRRAAPGRKQPAGGRRARGRGFPVQRDAAVPAQQANGSAENGSEKRAVSAKLSVEKKKRVIDKNSSGKFLLQSIEPRGSVRGKRANFTRLVLGCIEATFCK